MHNGELVLPKTVAELPKKMAGLYCIHFLKMKYHYIGQTGRLKERLREYRKPTQGTLQEYFLHQAFVDNAEAQLYISPFAYLSSMRERRELEHAELTAARAAKRNLLNRGASLPPYVKQLATEACSRLLDDWLKKNPFIDKENTPCA
jgi:hypothetical protein